MVKRRGGLPAIGQGGIETDGLRRHRLETAAHAFRMEWAIYAASLPEALAAGVADRAPVSRAIRAFHDLDACVTELLQALDENRFLA